MQNWSQQYEPSSISDLLGREREIECLKNIFVTEPSSTVAIVGPGGVGKTTLVRMVLKECLNYNIVRYDSVTYKNDKLFDELSNINCNNLVQRLRDQSPIAQYPTALIIDNLDTISLSSEKSIIDKIININIKKKLFPVILTINNSSPKVVDEIKGLSNIIRVQPLEYSVLSQIISKVCSENSVRFEDLTASTKMITDFCQGDLRLLLTVLQDIYLSFGQEVVSVTSLEDFFQNNTKKKNLDLHLFESFKKLMLCRGSVSETLTIYNNDKVLLPLILQENFHKDMQNRKLDLTVKVDVARCVSDYISQGDIVETYIYTEQNWHLQDMHCFLSCTAPISCLSSVNPYETENDIKYNLTFSSELNKTSLKNINRKNIGILYNTSTICPGSIHCVSSLFNELLRAEKYEELCAFAVNYSKEEPVKFIETVIKVDKCNPNVVFLNTRTKKQLANLVTLMTTGHITTSNGTT